jgi:ABC-type dipeptide/oligopeptide/nickel transport system permease subunit
MEGEVYMLLIPAVLLAAILLLFNFLGDALRDAFDSRQDS